MPDGDAERKGLGAAAVEVCNGWEEGQGRGSVQRRTRNGTQKQIVERKSGRAMHAMETRKTEWARSESRGGRGSGRVCEMS